MAAYDQGPLSRYNSLTDRHLMNYFSNDRMRRHLLKSGLITKGGEVVSDALYRIRIARREHRRRVRDLIAQAIIHKALEMERTRQIDIRKKIEEIAKIELVRRVRTDRSRVGDEECLAYFNEGDMSKRSKSAKARTRSLKSQSDYDENKLPATADEESRLRLQKLLPNEEIETKHLSQLDSLTLGEYAKILEKQDKFRMNKLPYLGMGNEYIQTSKPQRSRKHLKPQKLKVGKQEKDKTQDVALTQSARSSQPKGPIRPMVSILFNAPAGQRTFDVMVEQQPSGGNTLILYKESIINNTVFHLTSHRHKGFPFSLTFYIDNVKDSRISTCCEYKHKVGKRIGGPAGHFTLFRVEGDNPCYKCLAERDLANEKNGNKSKDAKSNEQGSSRHETISVRSTSEDPYKSADDLEFGDNSLKDASDTEEVNKVSPRDSQECETNFPDNNFEDSARGKTPEIEVDDTEVTQVGVHRTSSNNNAVENHNEDVRIDGVSISSEEEKKIFMQDKDGNIKETKDGNIMEAKDEDIKEVNDKNINEELKIEECKNQNDLFENKEEETKNITSSSDSSYSSDKPGAPPLIASKTTKEVNNSSSEDDTKGDNNKRFHPNKKFILPNDEDLEYDTSYSDTKPKDANVTKPNSFLNKVLGIDSNSSSSRSDDSELSKKSEIIIVGNLQSTNINGDDNNVDSKKYPTPREFKSIQDKDLHDSVESVILSVKPSEDEMKVEVNQVHTAIGDSSKYNEEDPVFESTIHGDSITNLKDINEQKPLVEGSLGLNVSNDETNRRETNKSNTNNSDDENDIAKDFPRDNFNINTTPNINLGEPEEKKENVTFYPGSQSTHPNLMESQRSDNFHDSEGSDSEDYSSSSASSNHSINKNVSNLIPYPGLSENDRMSLKLEIPKEEEVISVNNDATTLEESRDQEIEPQEISKDIKIIEEIEEKKIENNIHREDRSSFQRPPSSFTSSSYFGTETESEIPIEVEHQPEEETPHIGSKDILQDSLFEQFDVFFENEDITFKKAKDKFEAIGEQRVTSLIIRNCELPSYIFNFISNKLELKKDLQRIELTGCEVEISLLKLLAKALNKWPVLDTLIISNNVFVDYSLFDLINTLEHLYSNDKVADTLNLKLLDISSCGLQENDFGQIIKMIGANTRMENVVLDQNPLSEPLWKDLRDALMKNSNTLSVSLKNCVTDTTLLSEVEKEISLNDDFRRRFILN